MGLSLVIDDILGPEGLIARQLPGYEPRREQNDHGPCCGGGIGFRAALNC